MIHIEKGFLKSALINLNSNDIRFCKTEELIKLDKEETLDVSAEININFIETDFDYNVFDLHIKTAEVDLQKLQKFLSENLTFNKSFWNYRIILYQKLNSEKIEEISSFLNKHYLHFGGILIVKNEDYEHYSNYHKNLLVLNKGENKDNSYHIPKFLITDSAIVNSANYNLYFHKRFTILYNNINISIINNEMYNISKKYIKVCKDCPYKRVCVDGRKPIKNKDGIQYLTECSYDPYTDSWNN